MSELTTERLEKKIKSCIEIENCEVMMPLSAAQELLESRRILEGLDQPAIDGGWTARGISEYAKGLEAKLLAYEQAAKNPIAWVVGDEEIADFKNGREVCVMRDCDDEQLDYLPLYAAPVLPKQPELVENLKKVMNSWLAMEPKLVFQPEFTDVMMLLDAEPAPAQPVIPEQRQMVPDEIMPSGLVYSSALPEFESDDSNKVVGYHCWVHGETRSVMTQEQAYSDAMLVVEACRAAFVSTAQPVSEPYKLPSGYTLVPCKLTAENGAKSCMIGEFTEQTEISCPECFGDDECETCDGSGMIEVTVPVSWTTIKDIWAKGIEHFAAAPAQERE